MSDRYFLRREAPTSSGFEEGYWGVIKDPDGVVRDRRRERDLFLRDAAEEIAFLKKLPPGRILDVGCGLGFLLSALDDEWERHGVEVSSFAAKHASQWGTIHHGDLTSARYPARHFDVVVLYHVIEHVSDPVGLIREVNRVLRGGGILLFGTPDFDSGCARRFGDRYRLLHDQTHISLFSSDSAHRFLRDHAFVIDRVEYPFFGTRHFTLENLERLFDTNRVSPPFYGNYMTFYAHKPVCQNTVLILQSLGMGGRRELSGAEQKALQLVNTMVAVLESGEDVGLLPDATMGTLDDLARGILQESARPGRIRLVSPRETVTENVVPGFVIRIQRSGRNETRSPKEWRDLPGLVMMPESDEDPSVVEPEANNVLRFPVPEGVHWGLAALLVLEGLARDVASMCQVSEKEELVQESDR